MHICDFNLNVVSYKPIKPITIALPIVGYQKNISTI